MCVNGKQGFNVCVFIRNPKYEGFGYLFDLFGSTKEIHVKVQIFFLYIKTLRCFVKSVK